MGILMHGLFSCVLRTMLSLLMTRRGTAVNSTLAGSISKLPVNKYVPLRQIMIPDAGG